MDINKYIDEFFNQSTENLTICGGDNSNDSNHIDNVNNANENIVAFKIGGNRYDSPMYTLGDKIKSYYMDVIYSRDKNQCLNNDQKTIAGGGEDSAKSRFNSKLPRNVDIYTQILSRSEMDETLFKQIEALYNTVQKKCCSGYSKIIKRDINNTSELIVIPSVNLSTNDINGVVTDPTKVVPLVNKLVSTMNNLYIGTKEGYKSKRGGHNIQLLDIDIKNKPELEEPETWHDVSNNEEQYILYLHDIEKKYIKIIDYINHVIDESENKFTYVH